MNINIGDKIKKRRKAVGISATRLADALGVSKSTISNYEKGIRKPGIDAIQKLSLILGTSVGDLISFDDSFGEFMPVKRVRQIPVYSSINSSDFSSDNNNILDYTDLSSDYFDKGEYFALYIQGDSMSVSRICDGDIVIVRRQDEVNSGEIAVVTVENEDAVVRKVFTRDDTVTLMESNKNTNNSSCIIDKGEVRILGKVVEVKIRV